MPLGDTSMVVNAAAMYNVLGVTDLATTLRPIGRALTVPSAHVHWYEKMQVKEQRKMGHITVTGASADLVRERIATIAQEKLAATPPAPLVGVIMGSDSDLYDG